MPTPKRLLEPITDEVIKRTERKPAFSEGDFIYNTIQAQYGIIKSVQARKDTTNDLGYEMNNRYGYYVLYNIIDPDTREVLKNVRGEHEDFIIKGVEQATDTMQSIMEDYNKYAKLHEKFYRKSSYLPTLDKQN